MDVPRRCLGHWLHSQGRLLPRGCWLRPIRSCPQKSGQISGIAHQGTPERTFGHAWMGRNGRPRTCQPQGNLCQLGPCARYGFVSLHTCTRLKTSLLILSFFSLSLYITDHFDPSSLPVQFQVTYEYYAGRTVARQPILNIKLAS